MKSNKRKKLIEQYEDYLELVHICKALAEKYLRAAKRYERRLRKAKIRYKVK